MNTALLWLVLAAITALTDVCWTLYIAAVAEKRAHRAALWSALIVLTGSVSIISYIRNPWLVTASVAGAYVGTWVTLWWPNRRTKRKARK